MLKTQCGIHHFVQPMTWPEGTPREVIEIGEERIKVKEGRARNNDWAAPSPDLSGS